MKSLTVAYITSRPKPKVHWFLDSLAAQATDPVEVIFVNTAFHTMPASCGHYTHNLMVTGTAPKPSVWQGPHRLPRGDWWAASNARNTAIALCQTEWIAFVDDRSVLMPGWLDAVKRAMGFNYAVCGPYEKRLGMTVEKGTIKHGGIITGMDNRLDYVYTHWTGEPNPYTCPGSWWYGCSTALPLAWALQVNGYDETCDGLSGEDYIFGQMLENNGFEIRFDMHLKIVEDRSPESLGPAMIRRDKGVSPNDKSHALLNKLKGLKRAQHPFNLAELRDAKLSGKDWPIPTSPNRDWYDNQPLSEMEAG